MTDSFLVAKKLALIETCVHQLKTMAQPDRIFEDVREERFVEHTLQIAIQAALDVASHIVSDERLGEPRTNKELFGLLTKRGLIDRRLAERLSQMAGFRNVLVHAYQDVNLTVLRDILDNHLDDLLVFASDIRERALSS